MGEGSIKRVESYDGGQINRQDIIQSTSSLPDNF